MIKTRFFIFFFIFLLLSTPLSFPLANESIPDIKGRINDFADMLIPHEEIQLEKLLEENKKDLTNKIVVITIDDFIGDALEDYSMSLSEKWKIDQKDKANAVILLIAGRGREIHIEAGSDLKDALPDRICNSIIRKKIVPFFNGGSYFLGIKNGLNAIIKEIKDFHTYQNAGKDISETLPPKKLAVILSILAGFLVLWMAKGLLKTLRYIFISLGKNNGDKSKFKIFPYVILPLTAVIIHFLFIKILIIHHIKNLLVMTLLFYAAGLFLGVIIFFNSRIINKIWSTLFRNVFLKAGKFFSGVWLSTEEPSSEELRKHYIELSTEELIEFFKKDYTLIKAAKKIIREELENRGIRTEAILKERKKSKSNEMKKSIPKSLKIIAGFFVLIGVLAAIDIIRTLGNFRINNIRLYFNFNVSGLGLFIGPGLLRYSRGWRLVALVFIWLMLIVCPIIMAVSFIKCSFAPSLEISYVSNLVFSSFLFITALWAYLVLTSNDIRVLFGVVTRVKSKKRIPKKDIFICDNCNHEINEKDYYCSYCGAVFADSDKKCHIHDKPALGICMICKKAFCDECIIAIKNKFFCEEHSNYNFTKNGWASVYETENDDDAEIIKKNLDDNNIPCTIDNRKDPSFQLAFGLQGSIFVRVPFDYVLKAEKIMKDLDLSLQN